MKLSEIGATLTELKTQMAAFIAGTKPAAITAEQHTALSASATDLTGKVSALEAALAAAVKAQTDANAAHAATTAALEATVTKLTADMANKVAISTAGVAAAAGLAAGQTVAALAQGTDIAANGKTPLENIRAQMETETDPAKKAVLARAARALRAPGLTFKNDLVKATA